MIRRMLFRQMNIVALGMISERKNYSNKQKKKHRLLRKLQEKMQ